MLASIALLLVLDGAILSPGANTPRGVFALIVTLIVLGVIAATWRSNVRLEKQTTESGTTASSPS